jgi:hypothetical protein
MRFIIAGGRDYEFTEKDVSRLNQIFRKIEITEVVCGCARGVDSYGEAWAELRGIPVKRFPADWNAYGRSAGHLRNEQMAKYADCVILFPGGRGTDNMYKNAKKYGLKIIDLR